MNNSRVVEVIQKPSDLQCSQLVLVPKELGSALVTVNDIGLSPPVAAGSVVNFQFVMFSLGDLFGHYNMFFPLYFCSSLADFQKFDF